MTKEQEDLFVYLSALCFGMPKEEVDMIIEFRDRILHKLEHLDEYETILGKNKLTYEEEWVDDCGHKHHYYSKDNACLDKLGELEDIYLKSKVIDTLSENKGTLIGDANFGKPLNK